MRIIDLFKTDFFKNININYYFRKFFEIFFTPKCPICGLNQETSDVCYKCFNQIAFLNNACVKCQEPFEYEIPGIDVCIKCSSQDCDFYGKMQCVLKYNEFAKNLIVRFKNHQDFSLAHLFAKFLGSAVNHILLPNDNSLKQGNEFQESQKVLNDNIIIVPVPLYKKRLAWRGYNQSLILAKVLGKMYGLQVMNILVRVKDTNSQALKTTIERQSNVKGAFIIDDRYSQFIAGKRFVIIDDVITTGATVFECAKVLHKNKAKSVDLIAIARRLKRKHHESNKSIVEIRIEEKK